MIKSYFAKVSWSVRDMTEKYNVDLFLDLQLPAGQVAESAKLQVSSLMECGVGLDFTIDFLMEV